MKIKILILIITILFNINMVYSVGLNNDNLPNVEIKKDTSSLTINYINSSLNGSYVPYTGATGNVDLGNYNLTTTALFTHILNGKSPILVGDNFSFYNGAGLSSINNVTSICYKDGSCINSSNNYVPYTGSNSNVNLNGKTISNAQFTTSSTLGFWSTDFSLPIYVYSDDGYEMGVDINYHGNFEDNYVGFFAPYRAESFDLGYSPSKWRNLYLRYNASIGSVLINGETGNVSGINNLCYSNGTNCLPSSSGVNGTNINVLTINSTDQKINGNLNVTNKITSGNSTHYSRMDKGTSTNVNVVNTETSTTTMGNTLTHNGAFATGSGFSDAGISNLVTNNVNYTGEEMSPVTINTKGISNGVWVQGSHSRSGEELSLNEDNAGLSNTVVRSGTQSGYNYVINNYGISNSVYPQTKTTTGAVVTENNYGGHFAVAATTANNAGGSLTKNNYGFYAIVSGSVTNQASTCYGAYVSSTSCDTNYGYYSASQGVNYFTGNVNTQQNYTINSINVIDSKRSANFTNLTISNLINLNVMILPACNSITNGSIGRNVTATYGCNNSGQWSKIF